MIFWVLSTLAVCIAQVSRLGVERTISFTYWFPPLSFAVMEFFIAVIAVLQSDWPSCAVAAAFCAFFFWVFWRRRPRGPRKHKLRKAIGAKARAIRDKMVAAMPKPRLLAVPA